MKPVHLVIAGIGGLIMLRLFAMDPLKKLIARFEGESFTAYKDAVGKWTIGIGHLILPNETHLLKRPITRDESHQLFVKDSAHAMAAVKRMVKAPINANMLAALTSFAFNVGVGNLAISTLLKKLNAKDYSGAANEFLKWNKAGGKVLAGLDLRRKAERELFLKR